MSGLVSNSVLYSRVPYVAPAWLASSVHSSRVPSSRVQLGRFPTPIHKWRPVEEERDEGEVEFWIKRDDLSSSDLSGNKVRKLEFLLDAALEGGHDSIITIGGVQSNHARATAVAARQLGLDPFLILRTRNAAQDDPAILSESIVGNLMYARLVNAEIQTVSAATYATVGSASLVAQLTELLIDAGRNPFPIPVGGSNALGCFGYLDAVEEIRQQEEATGVTFDHVVFSCGSGGTASGLALGLRLCSGGSKSVHAIGVCDSPGYFYQHIRETAVALGVDLSLHGDVESWLTVHAGSGLGYARSSEDELKFILDVGSRTGIILDPVYSGKALYHFLREVLPRRKDLFLKGQKVLFIHTGGTAGVYDKADQLGPILRDNPPKPMLVKAPPRA